MKQFFSKLWSEIMNHKVISAIVALLLAAAIVLPSCLCTLVTNRYSRGIVPSEQELNELKNNGKTYEHIVMFGIDGAGGFFGDDTYDGFNAIFGDGSVTFEGVSQNPTISAQNWTSMMHGVRASVHGVNNSNSGKEKYNKPKYPSFFKVYADANPDAEMCSITNWTNINYGIIEDMPALTKISVRDGLENEDDYEDYVVDEMVRDRALDYIKDNDPSILFLCFDNVDHAGHRYGSASKEYNEAMHLADAIVKEIYDACIAKGWKDNTLFLLISDHGHRPKGDHGGNSKAERNITFAAAGKTVKKGSPEYFVTQDLASVVLYALGIKQPDSWQSKLPNGIFE